ncbi:MAG: SUMF1/EgtB/PvdO family nonheme iron enzyme, partial [Phycisphaerales bacterium]|nr:SUMF1/EgtB/PvdO family nonheme iron enzyme [Phycisphaerales bacterium]
GEPKQVTPAGAEYHSFDGCYLPDGRIVYTSTAPYQGLPCVSGKNVIANTYQLDRTTGKIRRLTFDQDANWNPTVLPDGRVLYLRWEYADTAHFYTRILMTMNPDGTNQKHFYGSNSYWPNSMWGAKPIPGAPTKFIAVVSGHHCHRPGRLVLFDNAKGAHETSGVVQTLPGRGHTVKPIIIDGLYKNAFPKFLNPIPLGTSPADGAGRYFLVSGKPSNASLWGIYLVDTFDNVVCIAEQDGYALNEPIVLAAKKTPRRIPDRVDLTRDDAVVYVANVYEGPGLKNVPKGSVKSLRVFTYHYSYYKSGSHEAIGVESSWDVKRILGTVPVAADGSVSFRAPANTPLSLQPLDKDGASLALMRSWLTAMPGESLGCVGCHEPPAQAAGVGSSSALRKLPVAIQPWLGKARNYSFLREVQPMLQRKCVGCHDGKGTLADGTPRPNFKSLKPIVLKYDDTMVEADGGPFAESYVNLSPYVRRPGPESNYHLMNPMEYHVSTSLLFQKLRNGHHGVTLSAEDWQRFATWTDLNAPFWGTWTDAHRDWANELHRKWSGSGETRDEQLKNIQKYKALRDKYQALYAGGKEDWETEVYSVVQAKVDLATIKFAAPSPVKTPKAATVKPYDAAAMQTKQAPKGAVVQSTTIPGGKIAMRYIPMASKGFYMAELEITNAQYRRFDSKHNSGVIDRLGKDQRDVGFHVTSTSLPVVRVSYNEAKAYAAWLSKQTGKPFRLPTSAEWELAARAGTAGSFYWGDVKGDFSKHANLADASINKFAARQAYNYLLRVPSVNDGQQIQCAPGRYAPNAFGLRDMIGNVSEWTTTTAGNPAARGGSWRDVPRHAGVTTAVPYLPHQRVYNVGIRLVMEAGN